MPANDYFRIAANNLRQGVMMKRQEIDQIRREIQQKEGESNQQIKELKNQIRSKEADLALIGVAERQDKIDNPSTRRALDTQAILNLNKEVSNKQNEFTTYRDQTLAKTREMERELLDMEQQAKELEAKK